MRFYAWLKNDDNDDDDEHWDLTIIGIWVNDSTYTYMIEYLFLEAEKEHVEAV